MVNVSRPASVAVRVIGATAGPALGIVMVTAPSRATTPVTIPKAAGGLPTSPANQRATRPNAVS